MLVDRNAAVGWRLIGLVEVSCALLFIAWFWGKGKRFHEANEFVENENVRQVKLFVALDRDHDGNVGNTNYNSMTLHLTFVNYSRKNKFVPPFFD